MRIWVINWSVTHRDKYYVIQSGRNPKKQYRKFSCNLPPYMTCEAPGLVSSPIANLGKVYSREATDRELQVINEVQEAEGD